MRFCKVAIEIFGDEILHTLKNRVPTKREVSLLFSACLLLTHTWTILHFLNKVPSYMIRMSLFDLFGVFAYTQVSALLESILLLSFCVCVSIALPIRLFKDKFIAQGTVLLSITFLWGAPAVYHSNIMEWQSWGPIADLMGIGLWSISYVAVICWLFVLIRRKKVFEEGIHAFVERSTVLSTLYLLVDVFSLSVVVCRNLS